MISEEIDSSPSSSPRAKKRVETPDALLRSALAALVWLSAIILPVSSPAQNDPAATIRQQYRDWLRAYEQKDLPGTMEIFAPDGISTVAGAADSDFNATRRSYEKSFASVGPSRQWRPVDLEIGASDELAYALADWEMVEAGADGAANVRLTNRSIDVLKRDGTKWKIIRSFTIPKDGREVKSSYDRTLAKVSPDTFTNGAREVRQTLMRWRNSYNGRDLAGTLASYDSSINGMYAG